MERKFVFELKPGDVFITKCNSSIRYCVQSVTKDNSLYLFKFTSSDGTLFERTYRSGKQFILLYHAQMYYRP